MAGGLRCGVSGVGLEVLGGLVGGGDWQAGGGGDGGAVELGGASSPVGALTESFWVEACSGSGSSGSSSEVVASGVPGMSSGSWAVASSGGTLFRFNVDRCLEEAGRERSFAGVWTGGVHYIATM